MSTDPFLDSFSNYFEVVSPLFYSQNKFESYIQISSPIPGPYFNYTVPTKFEFLDIIKGNTQQNFANIYLSERLQKSGLVEYLVSSDYKFYAWDYWLRADITQLTSLEIDIVPTKLEQNQFVEYSDVMNKVFLESFPNNPEYLKLCERSYSLSFREQYPHITSDFFAIFDDGKIVSAGGLVCNLINHVSYLHSGGTLSEYRNRGYQSALLKHRLKESCRYGCTCAYTMVEPGSQSWHNAIRAGFAPFQNAMILTKK